MALEHLAKWRAHLDKVWKEMKKTNPKARLVEAMKEAKKTYKKGE